MTLSVFVVVALVLVTVASALNIVTISETFGSHRALFLHVDTSSPVASEDTAVEIAWTRQFGSSGLDQGFGVAADVSGVYVVGHVGAALQGQVSAGAFDAFVSKYDPGGNELWTRQLGTPGNDVASGIDVDATGVYVAGHVGGALPGQTNAGGSDAFIRRYNTDGTEVWTRQFGTPDTDWGGPIAVADSRIYVAVTTNGVVPGQTSAGGYDVFIRELDLDGNEVWTRQFGTSGWDWVGLGGLAADNTGLYVAAETRIEGGSWLRKFDLNGNDLWTRELPAALKAVALDASGVYVAGGTNVTGGDAFLRKYDANGNEVWTRQFGTSESDEANGVAADASGVYVAGDTGGTLSGQTSAGDYDAFLRRYDANGNEVWTFQFGSSGGEEAYGIALEGSHIYLSGDTGGAFPGEASAGNEDAFVAKFSQPALNRLPTLGAVDSVPAVALPGQEVQLTALASDPDGDFLTYTWDFDDEASATGTTAAGGGTITATHAYAAAGTYAVSLTVDDGKGGEATQSATVRIVTPPSLGVTAEPITGTVPLTVSFAATPSGGVPPYSFEWDFGDGSSSTSQNPTHTYQLAGIHSVTLSVTDADGRTTTRTIQITVNTNGATVAGTVVPPWAVYALVAAVAVGVGGAILWRWRGRVRAPPPPPG